MMLVKLIYPLLAVAPLTGSVDRNSYTVDQSRELQGRSPHGERG